MHYRVLLTGVPLALLAGCGSYEPGQRTGQGAGYSQYVYSLYDQPGGVGGAAHAPSFPMKLAVAEVGQLQPSPKLVALLEENPTLFSRVESITGISDGDSYAGPATGDACSKTTIPSQLAMRRIQRLARDTGMDYLLIVGATVDSQSRSTPLSALTLTVIGSFIAPSERLTAQGQASAALIDLRGDRVVMLSSSSADDAAQAPVVGQSGVQDQQVRKLRDTVYGRLGRQFVDDCRHRIQVPST